MSQRKNGSWSSKDIHAFKVHLKFLQYYVPYTAGSSEQMIARGSVGKSFLPGLNCCCSQFVVELKRRFGCGQFKCKHSLRVFLGFSGLRSRSKGDAAFSSTAVMQFKLKGNVLWLECFLRHCGCKTGAHASQRRLRRWCWLCRQQNASAFNKTDCQ